MHVDRYMVNLFFEIRRNLLSDQRRDIRISSPDLGDTIVALYNKTEDEKIRLLIELFLERAGEEWINRVRAPKNRYRGVEVDETKDDKPRIQNQRKGKPRYYRGARIK